MSIVHSGQLELTLGMQGVDAGGSLHTDRVKS